MSSMLEVVAFPSADAELERWVDHHLSAHTSFSLGRVKGSRWIYLAHLRDFPKSQSRVPDGIWGQTFNVTTEILTTLAKGIVASSCPQLSSTATPTTAGTSVWSYTGPVPLPTVFIWCKRDIFKPVSSFRQGPSFPCFFKKELACAWTLDEQPLYES